MCENSFRVENCMYAAPKMHKLNVLYSTAVGLREAIKFCTMRVKLLYSYFMHILNLTIVHISQNVCT